LLLLPRSSAGLLGFRTTLFVLRIAHLGHSLPRPLQVFSNRCFALITPGTRQRLDLRAVLHHLFQRNQPFRAQHTQQLREQLIQLLLLLHAETR